MAQKLAGRLSCRRLFLRTTSGYELGKNTFLRGMESTLGAGFRNRTEDLPLTRRVLYQLS